MTDRDELLALAARCEAATGPDRELDADIACHAPICQADYVLSAHPSAKPGRVTRYFDDGGHGTFVCQNYTASLDAAMTLVREGWLLDQLLERNTVDSANWRWKAGLWRADSDVIVAGKSPATPALALCAAALRAKAAQMERGEG